MRAMPEVTVRKLSKKHIDRDVALTLDIFNEAWADNWAFVPSTKKEADKMASDFKLFLVPDLTTLVLIDGKPAAVAIALPNVNEIIQDLHGKLFPFRLREAPLSLEGRRREERALDPARDQEGVPDESQVRGALADALCRDERRR